MKKKIGDPEVAKYFMKGLYVKIIGALGTAIIYWYYYGGGDSIYYFWRAQKLREVLGKSFAVFWKLWVKDPLVYDYQTAGYFNALKAHDLSSYLVVKLAFLLSFPALNTYLVNALLFSVICYSGIWALFVKVTKLYPEVNKKYLAWAVLFIPSVFFWGSGLFKDTVTLGCTCWLVVALDDLFIQRKKILRSLIIIVITGYLIGIIKSYILLAMIPAVLIWITYSYRNKIRNGFVRQAVTPVFLVVSAIAGIFILQQMGSVFTKFNLENIEQKAEGMQRWHTARVEQKGSGSAYSLGHVDFSPTGLLSKAPAAINVTLFRPYPWEAGNPVMVISSIEAIIFLLLFLRIIARRPFLALREMRKDPFLLMSITFTLIFAFSVGFASYNFGALVRYKIPCLPFFGVFLAVLYTRILEKKQKGQALPEIVQ